jgi:hypothetical protein
LAADAPEITMTQDTEERVCHGLNVPVQGGNYMADAFAPVERKYANQVLAETWGHLAPKAKTTYPGYIVLTHACCGDIVLIDYDFVGLDSSPWLYDDLNDFAAHLSMESYDRDVHERIPRTIERGQVFRFDGTYRKFKNGDYRLCGKLRKVDTGHNFRTVSDGQSISVTRHGED